MISSEDYLDIEDYYISAIRYTTICVALELDLFEFIKKKPSNIKELATHTGLNFKILESLIFSLVSLKFLSRKNDEISITDKTDSFLIKSSPFFRGSDLIRKSNSDLMKRAHNSLKTGSPSLEISGVSITSQWENSEISNHDAGVFTNLMTQMISYPANYFSNNSNIKIEKSIIDVGGGSGTWADELRKSNPNMEITIFDLPNVITFLRKNFKDQNRITLTEGSFFSDKLPFGETYLLSNILHDWTIDKCNEIIKNISLKILKNGRLYINECILNDDRISPTFTCLFNFLMNINHGSQQLTIKEINEILVSNGFTKAELVSKVGYYHLLASTKL